MMDTSKDMVLEVLLDVSREEAPDLPANLIAAIYQIEKNRLYNHEPNPPLDALRKLIEDELSNYPRGGQ